MLQNSFIPQLLATGPPMQTQRFMQDGARPHTANLVLDFLHETFNLRVMSHRFPERHLIARTLIRVISSCGVSSKKVFQRRPENFVQLRAHIVQLCRALTEDLCRQVVTNIKVRLQEVVRQNGGHIEHVIH
jgi:hypothetical protein